LRGSVGGGIIQLDTDSESAIRAQPGYSGSPVVIADADDATAGDIVVGMLAVASRDVSIRDAYAMPVSRLVSAWPSVLADLTIPPCPYRGLLPFTREDAEAGLFVGREEEVNQLHQMVDGHPLVVVLGPSGVGKSSLVTAGLIPTLAGAGWCTTSFRPRGAPFEALAKALLTAEKPDGSLTLDDLTERADQLRSGGLAKYAARLEILRAQPVLVYADQFEEALTLSQADERSSFLDLLLTDRTLDDGRLHVVCALRADFLRQLLEHPDAGTHLRDRLFTLSPMSSGALARVIDEPARASGVLYEEGLVQQIARDARGGGGLPLLEFALTELWPHQKQRRITFSHYQHFGGVVGALSSYADRIFESLVGHFPEERISRVMLALVRSRGRAAEATSRIVSREHLGSDWEVAEELAKHRLLVLGYDSVRSEDTAELAHEVLIRAWPRFASWVNDDADFQHWLAAAEDVAPDDTLSDRRIGEAERWLIERSSDIPEQVMLLVQRSKSTWQRRVAELEDARNSAQQAARLAEARRLAAAAELALVTRGVPSHVPIALAIESLRTEPTLEGDTAVRKTVQSAPIQFRWLMHDGPVRMVAFSPDGSRIATASSDRSMRIIDAKTGNELARLAHNGPVRAVAFSRDGTRVATGSHDRTARIFDATAGDELFCLSHDGPVAAVTFSRDGTRIITGSEDRNARIFDTASGGELFHLRHDSWVLAVAFSPDGTRVATGSNDHSARIFDPVTGSELARLVHDGPVRAVTFSPDGTRVATGSDDHSARIFDPVTGSELARLAHDSPVLTVTFSPDGTRVAAGSFGGYARIFDPVTGSELARLVHDGPVRAVTFSPDGTRVATGSDDHSARIFGATAGAELFRFNYQDKVRALTFSRDGTKLAIGSDDGSVRAFDAATGSELFHLAHDGPVRAVAFSRDGKKMATGSDRTARLLDVTTGRERVQLPHDGPVRAVAFDPDGAQVATASLDHCARVFSAAGDELSRRTHNGPVRAVAFSPDGNLIATGSDDGSARILDAKTYAQLSRLSHNGLVEAVAFSRDSTRIATASDDWGARIFDVATGSEMRRLHHDGEVLAVVFSPDSARVATGSEDGSARIFDVATGDEMLRMDHDGRVSVVAFSRDSTQIATGSDDGNARVFDAATGRELVRLAHDGPVRVVAFNHDGTRVATGSNDSSGRIWLVNCDGVIEQAEERLIRNLTHREWRRYFRNEPYRKTRADLP
jgi:WD40 repeat protein